MTVGIPRETAPGETRVALVPEGAARLIQSGYAVHVERGAGAASFYPDAAYEEAGARLVDRADALAADLVLVVQAPDAPGRAALREGSTLVGFLNPLDAPDVARDLARQGVTAFAMELVPRISRAQKLDALSAMSSIAGYKAVLLAANALPRYFPLLTTAAGTVRPAQVLVLGAGVAGLQAIATARRLGARVAAFDIRAAVREEIESLGAQFVDLSVEVQDSRAAGGYAQAQSDDAQQQQARQLAPHVARADVVISTALIPGRRAPLLVTREAVEAMPEGGVVVDLAAPGGGNCALTRPGETVVHGSVTILAPLNIAALVPAHASQLYARTVAAFVQEFTRDGAFAPDFADEIAAGACLTRGGEIVNARVQALLEARG